MKHKLLVTLLFLLCIIIFTGCCSHEAWNDADCVTPKTCAQCGQTDGSALGHTWQAATCTAPKTCETCGVTDGEAKGHHWIAATCTAPETCENCNETRGSALTHNWQEATTEAPKTCSICAQTEGERIITDSRFTTAACKSLFGKWALNLDLPGEQLGNGLDAYVDVLPCKLTIEFCNDGTANMKVMPTDEKLVKDVIKRYTMDLMLKQFADAGMTAAQADNAMKQTYGMTIEEYVTAEVEKLNIVDLFSTYTINYVYYASGGQLYLGFGWNNEMSPAPYSIEGNHLTIEEDLAENGSDKAVLTKVTE